MEALNTKLRILNVLPLVFSSLLSLLVSKNSERTSTCFSLSSVHIKVFLQVPLIVTCFQFKHQVFHGDCYQGCFLQLQMPPHSTAALPLSAMQLQKQDQVTVGTLLLAVLPKCQHLQNKNRKTTTNHNFMEITQLPFFKS